MNKANVFLLVVVSSLLTYISTATQPAVTAGVAQEKWEYFKSNKEVQTISGKTFNTRSTPAGTCITVSESRDELVGLKVEVELSEGVNSSLTTKSFDTIDESKAYFYKVSGRLFELSGENGWHVFQVEEEQKDTMFGFESVMHWRRRVQ